MLTTRTILAAALAVGLGTATVTSVAYASGDAPEIKRQTWSFGGLFGKYDKNQLQRGFKVYTEICSACHGLDRIAFRNLTEKGGPEFPVEQFKKYIAEKYEVTLPPDDNGEVKKGPAKLSDKFPPLYANEKAARAAQNGALPPDLSIIAKARSTHYTGPWYFHPGAMVRDIATAYQEGGADYLFGLLTGYGQPPAYVRDDHGHLKPAGSQTGANVLRCVAVVHEKGKPDVCQKLAEGMNYNKAFPGHQIAMANPFEGHTAQDPRVPYTDGTTPTIEQYAQDVAAFLSWASDPTLNQRKEMGWLAILYLVITSLLLYVAKRRVWAGVAH
ncbi:MAG: cytochrome c1 [Hyphomicrobiaceae bacterium]|nr:cytochrome c1 [Hyphomicrobiaceae bacterium]